jgi:hypothetical protein
MRCRIIEDVEAARVECIGNLSSSEQFSPCGTGMPTLDRMRSSTGEFEVVAMATKLRRNGQICRVRRMGSIEKQLRCTRLPGRSAVQYLLSNDLLKLPENM